MPQRRRPARAGLARRHRVRILRGAAKFARRYAKYNRGGKPIVDQVLDGLGLDKWALPLFGKRSVVSGVGIAGAASALTGAGMVMKRKYARRGGARLGVRSRSRARAAARNVVRRARAMGVPAKQLAAKRKAAGVGFVASLGKRRRVTKKTSGASELQFSKSRIRIARPMDPVSRLSRLSCYRQVCRFSNVAPVDAGSLDGNRGAMWLGPVYTETAVVANSFAGGRNNIAENSSVLAANAQASTSFLRAPIHVYALTRTLLNDSFTNASGTQPSAIAFQPFIANATGTVSFAPLWGVDQPGTATAVSWQTEYRNSSSTPTNQRFIAQEWYDVRLCLRNATQQVTYFDIWVASFKPNMQHLDPIGTANTAQELADRSAFWQVMSAQGMAHPMISRTGITKALSKLNIRRRYRYVMDPKHSTEVDASTNMKIVNISIKDGRCLDYQEQAQNDTNATLAAYNLQNPNRFVSQGEGQANNYDHPKQGQRLYLFIRAYDPSGTAVTGADDNVAAYVNITAATTPSYDIVIRKSEVALRGL